MRQTGAVVNEDLSTGSQVRPVRVAVLNTHPIQYFAPLYAYLTQTEPGMDITALYCTDYSLRGAIDRGFSQEVRWDIDLLSGYRSVFLGPAARERVPAGFLSLIVPELWRELRSGRYDVLWLHGYGYLASWVAFAAAKSVGMPVMLRGETHLGLSRPGWRRLLRDSVLRVFFRHIDAFLAIGSRNREYYLASGVPSEQIHMVPYSVDNDRFIEAAAAAKDDRAATRARLGIPVDLPVVLYASKLVERKHPHTLLRAASNLQLAGLDFALCMVGSGPMEAQLRSLSQELKLRNVSFVGFVNQNALPAVYSASDVFVLASASEPWGLVVNEVMCAGLPIIVSDEAGCAADLVEHHVNGWHVPSGDVTALAQALRLVLVDDAVRAEFGKASLKRIRQWSYAECAKGLRTALASILPNRAVAQTQPASVAK